MTRKGDWMQTYTGRQYWPLDPRPDEVHLEDIAHHLSMLCRYCGASTRFYSVAEHTLGVLYVGMKHARRLGFIRNQHLARYLLLHDAAEAYCHDIIRPIKRSIEGYDEIEGRNEIVIYKRFGIDQPRDWVIELVNQADSAMLLAERHHCVRDAGHENWAMGATAPNQMIDDAHHYLRMARWQPWRKWRWWIKRRFLSEMRALGLQ